MLPSTPLRDLQDFLSRNEDVVLKLELKRYSSINFSNSN